MAALTAFAWETRWLGLRTLRRFYRVPANMFSIILFPLIQLFVFSQMYKDIVQLPGFGGQTSYLAYLAPGQIVFTVFFATAWSGGNLLFDYRNGMLDKLRVTPISRYSILAGELVPLFFECLVMGGVILLLSVVLGATVDDRDSRGGDDPAARRRVRRRLVGDVVPARTAHEERAGDQRPVDPVLPDRLHVDGVRSDRADARLAADGQSLEPAVLRHRGDARPDVGRLGLDR